MAVHNSTDPVRAQALARSRPGWAVVGGLTSAAAALLRDVVPAYFLTDWQASQILGLSLLNQMVYVLVVGETRLLSEVGLQRRMAPSLLTPSISAGLYLLAASSWVYLAGPTSPSTAMVPGVYAGILLLTHFARYLCDFYVAAITVSGGPPWTLSSPALQNLVAGPLVAIACWTVASGDREISPWGASLLAMGVLAGYVVQFFAIRGPYRASLATVQSERAKGAEAKDVGSGAFLRLAYGLELARLPEVFLYAAIGPAIAVPIMVARRLCGGMVNAILIPLGQLNYLDAVAGRRSRLDAVKLAWAGVALVPVVVVTASYLRLLDSGGSVAATAVGCGTVSYAAARIAIKLRVLRTARSTVSTIHVMLALVFTTGIAGLILDGAALKGLQISSSLWIAIHLIYSTKIPPNPLPDDG